MKRRAMTGSGIATHFLVAASAAALVAPAAFGQSADKPLGEILESIDAAEAEAPPSATEPPPPVAPPPRTVAPPRATVTEGIVPTDLPPSQPADLPGEAEESPLEAPAEERVPTTTGTDRPQPEAGAAEAEAPPPAPAAEAPPLVTPPRSAVTEGIVPTELPPSQPADLPGEAEESPSEAPADAQVLSITDAERLQAEAEAAEQARIAELDRRRAERIEAARQAREAALADYQRLLEEREAAIARAETDYQAALERNRLQAERDRAAWQEQVRACEAGDRLRCFNPENPPR